METIKAPRTARFDPSSWGAPRSQFDRYHYDRRIKAEGKARGDDGRRGVILLPTYRNSFDEEIQRGQLDFDLLRHALLYWDLALMPQAVLFDDSGGTINLLESIRKKEPWQVELEAMGALTVETTLHHDLSGKNKPLTMRDAWRTYEGYYLECEFQAPGQWHLTQYGGHHHLDIPVQAQIEGAMGSLAKLLPTPAQGVGYREIVEFRRQHMAALRELRSALDALNLEIVKNPESAFAFNDAHRRLDLALEAVWRYAAERRLRPVRSSMRVLFAAVASGFQGLLSGSDAAPLLQLPLATAASVLAVGSAVVGGGIQFAKERFADPLQEGRGIAGFLLNAVNEGVVAER